MSQPMWPDLNLARSVHDPDETPWVSDLTDDYGNIEAETYVPKSKLSEAEQRLERLVKAVEDEMYNFTDSRIPNLAAALAETNKEQEQ